MKSSTISRRSIGRRTSRTCCDRRTVGRPERSRRIPVNYLQFLPRDFSTTLEMTEQVGVMFKRLLSPPEQSRAAKKNRRDLWLDHFCRRRVASALSRFHGESYAFRRADFASFWISAFYRHAGFRVWHALSPEWTSQCGGICICHIDRSAVRRTDNGHTMVFWGVAGSPRALICHRGLGKLAMDFVDMVC